MSYALRSRLALGALVFCMVSTLADAATTNSFFGNSDDDSSSSSSSNSSSKSASNNGNQQSDSSVGFNYSPDDSSSYGALAALLGQRNSMQRGQPGAGGPMQGAKPTAQDVSVAPQAPSNMFGSQLFGGTFHNSRGSGFNPDYTVSIGDTVTLRMWGAFMFDGQPVVDPQGNIFIPNVGPVEVAGVRNGDLNNRVLAAVRKVYKANVNVYASLDVAQPVKVYVTGYVKQPGMYGGVASESILSYLDKAGGVDVNRGSYVDVTVKRGDLVRKHSIFMTFC